MKPELIGKVVRAACPTCKGAITTFEDMGMSGGTAEINVKVSYQFRKETYDLLIYKLLRCAGCGRGGLATICRHSITGRVGLADFYPTSTIIADLPGGVPGGVVAEFREAEVCASAGAYRGACALLRSALEKTLSANGYDSGDLYSRINKASADGVITEARKRRAHEGVRVLANDILHEEWREVSEQEYLDASRYVQRILEDLYDDRDAVEALLIEAGRIKPKDADQAEEGEGPS